MANPTGHRVNEKIKGNVKRLNPVQYGYELLPFHIFQVNNSTFQIVHNHHIANMSHLKKISSQIIRDIPLFIAPNSQGDR